MNAEQLEDVALHAYLGIAAALPPEMQGFKASLEIKESTTKLSVNDGLGHTQSLEIRTKKLDAKLDKLEKAMKNKRLAEEIENSDTPAGKALVEKVKG